MDVSKRIEFIIENLEKVNTIADIGTDHGYVPLIALERELCEKAIACDINKDPLDKARLNAILEGIGDELELREYLYTNNYEIIKEDLCFDEGIYYELFKVRSAEGNATELDNIYYEISPILLRNKNPLMKDYLQFKLDEYNRILGFITEATVSANKRREEIKEKISIITSMLNYL